MKLQNWTRLLLCASFAVVLVSCSSPTPNATTGKGTNIDEEGDVAAQNVGDMGSDIPEPARINTVDGVRYGAWENIHFDYDSATIRSEDRHTLEVIAKWMKGNSAKKIMIAGNCDERGTLEYNRALGQRRASAAREYLVGLGAPAGNIGTVSWGEERPIDASHHEEAWARNRRDELGIVNGTSD